MKDEGVMSLQVQWNLSKKCSVGTDDMWEDWIRQGEEKMREERRHQRKREGDQPFPSVSWKERERRRMGWSVYG